MDLKQVFADRLNAKIKSMEIPEGKRRFNASAYIADYVQRSESAVRKWLTGNGLPEIEVLVMLAQLFKCSTDHLLGNDSESGCDKFGCVYTDSLHIPLLGHKEEGWVCLDALSADSIFSVSQNSPFRFMIHAPSDAMWPTIRKAEVVVVDCNVTGYEENEILLVAFDDSLMLRRLQRRFGSCAVIADNTRHYPEILVDNEKIKFLAELPTTHSEDGTAPIDRLKAGEPLLHILKTSNDYVVVIGRVYSCVRSFGPTSQHPDFP